MPPRAPRSLLGRHRQLAPRASVRVSPLCLGTAMFGVAGAAVLGECDKETAFAIMDRFIGLGGNFIDTANAYQAGQAEVWVGDWMAARNNRDEIILATKYSSGWKSYLGDDVLQSNFGGNHAKSLHLSVQDSLKKLQTSYIDLLYVHYWDYTTDVADLMQSLNSLVVTGKVLYLGISDTPAWVVAKANQYAQDHGLRTFSVYQGLWNASIRDMERDIVPMCRDYGMAIAPWGAMGQGRFQTEAMFREREEKNLGRKNKVVSELDKKVSKVLEDISNAHNASVQSIAVAYLLQKAPYVFPIIGCRKMEHLEGTMKALEVSLSKRDLETIDTAYGFSYGFPHDILYTVTEDPQSHGSTESSTNGMLNTLGTFDWVEGDQPIRPNVGGN